MHTAFVARSSNQAIAGVGGVLSLTHRGSYVARRRFDDWASNLRPVAACIFSVYVLSRMSGRPMNPCKRDFSGDHRERKDYALGTVTGLSNCEHLSQPVLAHLLRDGMKNLPNALGETIG
jgi:hypothetical protein